MSDPISLAAAAASADTPTVALHIAGAAPAEAHAAQPVFGSPDAPAAPEAPREVDPSDLPALRFCAMLCWQRRAELALDDGQLEQVLLAWLAVGSLAEATAAAELLAARREADRQQKKFEALLGA